MPFTRSKNFSYVIFYIDHEVSVTPIAVNQERRVDDHHHIQSHALNQRRVIRVWMGFSVKWCLPIIFSVLSCFFFFSLFTVPGENNVKRLEGFSWKTRNLLALSTAPGKSVKTAQRSCGSLWTSTVFGNLAQSSEIFWNYRELLGNGRKPLDILIKIILASSVGAVFISFSTFWKKILFQWNFIITVSVKMRKI